MSEFVQSLSRLYEKKKIKIEQLQKLLTDNKITKEEFEYITGRK